ncbi:hypothetical protein GXP67_14080 [Rhodocytophaga rosea]|uniref:Uncharacterized protein n=1 Tax=Rhodocytophaga rosea TaxID=2704465 RepID=A0A6C0GI56_9BACT|nr:alpha-2-macroglobulin family protein [Rhodocytophaga rosea]QHT67678.1 hypothetical protein GXP67_14080 [Rhodocytophaga rosea]
MQEFRKSPKNLILATFILCFLAISAFQLPDNGFIARIKTRLESYQDYARPDKVYLHTDRAAYTNGETLWLKAYQVHAADHRPHALSRVIYIELLNSRNQAVLKQKMRVENGYGYGQFTIPDNLPSGTYILRAFNNWMRNSSDDFFFTKTIRVFNLAQTEPTNTLPLATNSTFDLQFFPEGGNLIEGLKSSIAFKAVNTAGESIPVEGTIVTAKGDTITSFKSFHAGMGAFELQPVSGQKYLASVRLTDSTAATFALGQALSSGMVLHASNTTPGTIQVRIQSNARQKGILVAQSRGTLYFSEQIDLAAKQVYDIPTATIPDGILAITLFDELGNPQAERLSFVNKQQNLRIQVNPNKKIYEPREKITLDISVTDAQGNPVSANLSMAVTDAGLPQVHQPDILSYLLLSSDLKGNIEQPSYYFSEDPKAKQALDYLLMTQGWRRFTWQDILNNNIFPEQKFEMEGGISIGGRLKNANDAAVVPNQLVILSAPGAVPPFQQQYTDQSGNFYFSDLHFNDDKEVFLQVPSTINDVAVKAEVDTTMEVGFAGTYISAIDAAQAKEFTEKSKKRIQIETMYKQEDTDTIFVEAATPGKNKKNPYTLIDAAPDHNIELDNYNEFPDMIEVLREIVPGILLQSKKGVINGLRILDIKRKLYFKENPMYFIDGIPVYSAQDVFKLDPGMVETIEVYGRPEKLARFEQLGKNGVLAIHTRTQDYYPEDAKNLFQIPMRGYLAGREFYSPVYENTQTSRKPDFRPVAYWNSRVISDANGKASVSFYNPDNITTYQIQIEGISGEGLPGIARQSYQVKLPLQSGR